MSTVSCIITSYNNSAYIERAIRSVLNQTRAPEEIIVADDASTDGSIGLLQNLASQHSTIKLLLNEKNIGVASNRDQAIRQAKGTYITTLDGDDIYLPGKIEAELNALASDCNSVAFSDVDWIDGEDRTLQQLSLQHIHRLPKAELTRYLLFRQGPIPRDMMYSKELFLKCGGYNNQMTIYEDWDLKLRMALYANMWSFSNVKGIQYRRHGAGLSSADHLQHLHFQTLAVLNNKEQIRNVLPPNVIPQAIIKICAMALGAKQVIIK